MTEEVCIYSLIGNDSLVQIILSLVIKQDRISDRRWLSPAESRLPVRFRLSRGSRRSETADNRLRTAAEEVDRQLRQPELSQTTLGPVTW